VLEVWEGLEEAGIPLRAWVTALRAPLPLIVLPVDEELKVEVAEPGWPWHWERDIGNGQPAEGH